jgi:hypothetical protein
MTAMALIVDASCPGIVVVVLGMYTHSDELCNDPSLDNLENRGHVSEYHWER